QCSLPNVHGPHPTAVVPGYFFGAPSISRPMRNPSPAPRAPQAPSSSMEGRLNISSSGMERTRGPMTITPSKPNVIAPTRASRSDKGCFLGVGLSSLILVPPHPIAGQTTKRGGLHLLLE